MPHSVAKASSQQQPRSRAASSDAGADCAGEAGAAAVEHRGPQSHRLIATSIAQQRRCVGTVRIASVLVHRGSARIRGAGKPGSSPRIARSSQPRPPRMSDGDLLSHAHVETPFLTGGRGSNAMHMTPAPEWVAWAELGTRLLWVLTAAAVSHVMARRGHDRGWWVIVGLVLGPVAVVAACVASRRARRREPIVVAPGRADGGGTDVLIVVDPADPGAGLAGGNGPATRLHRVVLATVVGRDTFDVQARKGELRRARGALETAARAAAWAADPRLIIVEGRPDDAVARLARAERLPLVLVPPTAAGRRLSARLASEPGMLVADVLGVLDGSERFPLPHVAATAGVPDVDHYNASLPCGQASTGHRSHRPPGDASR